MNKSMQWHLGIYKRLNDSIFFPSQEFDDYRDADDAVYEMNGKDLMGERLVSCGTKSLASIIMHTMYFVVCFKHLLWYY